MKTHRLFIDQPIVENEEIVITDPDVIHQVRDVLRLKKGDSLILLNNTGLRYLCTIKIIMKKNLIFSEVFLKKDEDVIHEERVSVKLFPSMIKKDKIEWVIQKCTELGVDEFHPIVSQRTEKLNINSERMEKIIKEASEQSGRVTIPKLFDTESLEEVLSKSKIPMLALDMAGEKLNVSQIKKLGSVGILIGPEGGWDKKDLELFKNYKVKTISIHKNVLRAETASVAISSLLLSL